MTLRGVRAGGTQPSHRPCSGTLREDPRSRAEFLALTVGPAERGGSTWLTLAALTEAGVAIWLDDLSRARLASGSLARPGPRPPRRRGSRPTRRSSRRRSPAATATTGRSDDLARRGVEVERGLRMLTTSDVRWACDVLRPVYDASDGVDGRVSIEVDPRLAHDTEDGRRGAPAVVAGRPAEPVHQDPGDQGRAAGHRQCLAEGISINVTLIFSLPRYAEVMEAFLAGMERARAAGRDLSRLASVASFFVSRVDTEIDKRLDEIGTARGEGTARQAAIANARLAFQAYEEVFAPSRGTRWPGPGARPQRPLWASTGVKDPAYADTRYVVDLVTTGVVNTMPEATLRAVADHGVLRGDTVRGGTRRGRSDGRPRRPRHRLRRRDPQARARRPDDVPGVLGRTDRHP